MLIRETAFAKINLALHVRARREDGYHVLETVFAFAEDGDSLTGAPADDVSLSITGPFAAGLSCGADNLVQRAAFRVQALFGVTRGACLTLDKQLPVAAGIGGGSADAAAAIRLLIRLWELPVDDPRIFALAAELGADVPACLESRMVRGDGVGDVLTSVSASALDGMPLLLINPGISCLTGPVFQAWDGVDRGPLGNAVTLEAFQAARNDLSKPAQALHPAISTLLQHMVTLDGARLVRMSGSGATCFALFETVEQRDAAALHFPDVWTMPTRLRAA